MVQWLKRRVSLCKQWSTVTVSASVTDISEYQHFISPCSISNSKTAESSAKWKYSDSCFSMGFACTGNEIFAGALCILCKKVLTKQFCVMCFLLGNSHFICQHFGMLRLFHLLRQVGMNNEWGWEYSTSSTPVILHTYRPIKMEQSVLKCWHIKFRCRGITEKKAYNIQNTAKVRNQEYFFATCQTL